MLDLCLNLYRIIFARKKFRSFNQLLFQLSMRGIGILNDENDRTSGERYLIRKILPSILRNQNPLFVDVGANIGNYTKAMLDCFPKASIHAFEPHPRSFAYLATRFPPNRVTAHNVALGDACGQVTLYDRADVESSCHASLHQDVISDIHKQPAVAFEVRVETLDEFAQSEGLRRIDFIKIDTEGNELAVLRGASKLLESERIGCIQFEFNEMNVVSRVFLRDFRKLLRNFELYRLLPNGLLDLNDSPLATELFGCQNIVALPK